MNSLYELKYNPETYILSIFVHRKGVEYWKDNIQDNQNNQIVLLAEEYAQRNKILFERDLLKNFGFSNISVNQDFNEEDCLVIDFPIPTYIPKGETCDWCKGTGEDFVDKNASCIPCGGEGKKNLLKGFHYKQIILTLNVLLRNFDYALRDIEGVSQQYLLAFGIEDGMNKRFIYGSLSEEFYNVWLQQIKFFNEEDLKEKMGEFSQYITGRDEMSFFRVEVFLLETIIDSFLMPQEMRVVFTRILEATPIFLVLQFVHTILIMFSPSSHFLSVSYFFLNKLCKNRKYNFLFFYFSINTNYLLSPYDTTWKIPRY